ncbi:MAG: response regulator [Prolixibacteraceae bacterium]|jgi:PAS domain S-box-containing protein|nr:response regulator [Prolixibacteraceae bacterium]
MGNILDINIIPTPIIVIDTDNHSVDSNDAFISLFGIDITDIDQLNKHLQFPIITYNLSHHNQSNFFQDEKGAEVGVAINSNQSNGQTIISISPQKTDLQDFLQDKNCINFLSNIPLGIIIKDMTSDETIFVSDYLTSKIGYSYEELTNNPWRIFTYDEDIAMQEAIMRDKLHNGLNAVYFDKRIVSKNGRIFWFSEYIRTFEHSNKKYQLIALRDISNEKEIETELERAKHIVEDAERLKSAFLDNLPHEIRTPLHAITGFTSLLIDPDLSNEERVEYVKFIQDSSNDILNLMDNIIEIAKLETNQIKPKREKCYINSIIDKSYNDIISKQEIMEKPQLTVEVNKDNNDPLFTVVSDPERIYQILSHLLNNALKFTETGGIEFGYDLKENNRVEFFVKDTGIGIASEEHDIIFKKFGKSGNINTNKNRGSGLGLTLSKKLVELLNGTISFESTVDEGSLFKFEIPVEKEQKITITRPSVKGETNWSSKTILVAEDTDSNYFFIEAFLERTHANLIWAQDGFEAVQLFKENKIDLVLMDIMMPEKDGYDATREIKKINTNVPVIAQTALALPDDEEKCYNAGCNFVLVKPINSEDLIATIKRFL